MLPRGNPLRLRSIALFKELHRLGRDYPDPNYHFIPKLRSAFRKNAKLTDPEQIQKLHGLAEFVKKETETLYMLKKYRALRRRYVRD